MNFVRKTCSLFISLIGLFGLGCPTTPHPAARITPLILTNEAPLEVSALPPLDGSTNRSAISSVSDSNSVPTIIERTTNPVVPSSGWISWPRWAEANGLGTPRLTRRSPGLDYSLETKGGILLVKMGPRQAFWNGLILVFVFFPS